MLFPIYSFQLAWTTRSMWSPRRWWSLVYTEMTLLGNIQVRGKGTNLTWRLLNWVSLFMAMTMSTLTNPLFISRFEIHLNEIIFEIYFELVLNECSILLLLFLLQRQFKLDSDYFLDSSNWDGHERFVATSYCITSVFEVLEAFLSHLNPSVDESRIVTSFVLHQFTLEEYLIIGISQVDQLIMRQEFFFFSDSGSSILTRVTIQVDVEVFNYVFSFSSLDSSLQWCTIPSLNDPIATALLDVVGCRHVAELAHVIEHLFIYFMVRSSTIFIFHPIVALTLS